MEIYQEKVLPFVQQANRKEVLAPQRYAYERLIFLILSKDYCYTPRRFVESRLFATLGLKPYGNEKMAGLKARLGQMCLQYADHMSISCIARTLHQTHWHDINTLEDLIPSQHTRTKLYNQGAMIGVYGEKGNLGDFLQRCISSRNTKVPYMYRQDGFATFRGVGPLLIEQMELVFQHYGIDPNITAVELEYFTALYGS